MNKNRILEVLKKQARQRAEEEYKVREEEIEKMITYGKNYSSVSYSFVIYKFFNFFLLFKK